MKARGQKKIVYCHCAYARVVPAATKQAVLEALTSSGLAFESVPDLCEMSAKRDPDLRHLLDRDDVTLFACYPRAVHGLCRAVGFELDESRCEIVNMREGDAENHGARAGKWPSETTGSAFDLTLPSY